jgi:hypothetical protein
MMMYKALDLLYKFLLYFGIPYVVLSNIGFSVTNALYVYALIITFDALASGSGWFVHRENEYELFHGALSIYLFTACWVLLALLIVPESYWIYLPIIAFLGFIGLKAKANRKFEVRGFITSTLTLLTILLLTTIPFVIMILPIALLGILLYYARDRVTIVKLVVATVVTIVLLILSISDLAKLIRVSALIVAPKYQLVEVPEVFMQTLFYAGFEEFIGRGFIPYVGAGLSSYVFATLHIPKILIVGLTDLNSIFAKLGLSAYSLMYMLISGFAWICLGTILLVHVWRRSGIFGSTLAHALVNTIIVLIGMGYSIIALGIVISLALIKWFKKL